MIKTFIIFGMMCFIDPKIEDSIRDNLYKGWKVAVKRTLLK